jgi:hypothetical protein
VERAHALSLRDGDRLAAAGRRRASPCTCCSTPRSWRLSAVWIKRAERLLEGHDDTPVHAWVAVARNYERLLSGDFRVARQWARRAIELGT